MASGAECSSTVGLQFIADGQVLLDLAQAAIEDVGGLLGGQPLETAVADTVALATYLSPSGWTLKTRCSQKADDVNSRTRFQTVSTVTGMAAGAGRGCSCSATSGSITRIERHRPWRNRSR